MSQKQNRDESRVESSEEAEQSRAETRAEKDENRPEKKAERELSAGRDEMLSAGRDENGAPVVAGRAPAGRDESQNRRKARAKQHEQ